VVAVVRGGWIWVGRPGRGKLRRLARGRSPSWSPDGSRLAFARDGYIRIVRVAGGAGRRLVRGGAPAWSPSGERIAFVGSAGAVEVVAAGSARPHRVGSVRGTAVDWQPIPTSASQACRLPSGSTVLASNREAVVFSRDLRSYGCLRDLGRARLLLDASMCYCGPVTAVRLAGRFAALQSDSGKSPLVFEDDTLYDLSSGKSTNLASVSSDSSGLTPVSGLDSSTLDSSGFAAWRQTIRPVSRSITALSCPSEALCVADDASGNVLSSTDPTGGANAWSLAALATTPSIQGVACPSVSLCVAVGANADGASDVLTTTDPTGGTTAWTATRPPQDDYYYAISCPSTSLCVAGGRRAGADGGAATIFTSTEPTSGANAWIRADVAAGFETVGSVSCPSASLCVAMGDTGDIFASTDPTGGTSGWTRTTIGQGFVQRDVACPSASLCVAVDNNSILSSTDPTGGASAWTEATVDPGYGLGAVSCPSVSLCVAGDSNGNILTSTDPTGGASAWTKAPIDPGHNLGAVSCPSVSLCVAGDSNGNVLTSTDPTGGASAWSSAPVDMCPSPSAPCISEGLYARDDQGTRVIDTAPPGHGTSIGNMAFKGDSLTLTWTHDGAQRQLPLH
jgi:hypothetical protein